MRLSLLAQAALVAAAFGSTGANGQTYKGVAFAGIGVSDGWAAYAGAMTSLPGSALGRGFGIRGTVNSGQYTYVSGPNEIDGSYYGGDLALVYQLSGNWGWSNFSAGPRISHLNLSPADPANEREGTRIDLGLQTDGALNIDPSWRLGWLASVGVADEAYQLQGDLGRIVDETSQTRLGIEAALQGDPAYDSRSIGGFVATRLGLDFEGRLSVGASDQEGRNARAYAAIGVSKLF